MSFRPCHEQAWMDWAWMGGASIFPTERAKGKTIADKEVILSHLYPERWKQNSTNKWKM